MTTPIRPSLADALRARPQGTTTPASQTSSATENPQLAAQRAFFQRALGNAASAPTTNVPATTAPQRTQVQPAITPATFKATDIASGAGAENITPLRPGSLLNIVV